MTKKYTYVSIERALEKFAKTEHQEKVKEWVNGYIFDADASDRFAARILS